MIVIYSLKLMFLAHLSTFKGKCFDFPDKETTEKATQVNKYRNNRDQH